MKVISSEAKRLGLMVGQILDITRIEEGRMNIETKVCGADELINVAISTYYPMLNKNNNRLEVQIEEGLPDVLADPVRVSQVLANLISNAVRFTADGKITVSAKEEGNFVAIRVADTGTGIIRELLPFIFDRYVTKQKIRQRSGYRHRTWSLYLQAHCGGPWRNDFRGKRGRKRDNLSLHHPRCMTLSTVPC